MLLHYQMKKQLGNTIFTLGTLSSYWSPISTISTRYHHLSLLEAQRLRLWILDDNELAILTRIEQHWLYFLVAIAWLQQQHLTPLALTAPANFAGILTRASKFTVDILSPWLMWPLRTSCPAKYISLPCDTKQLVLMSMSCGCPPKQVLTTALLSLQLRLSCKPSQSVVLPHLMCSTLPHLEQLLLWNNSPSVNQSHDSMAFQLHLWLYSLSQCFCPVLTFRVTAAVCTPSPGASQDWDLLAGVQFQK